LVSEPARVNEPVRDLNREVWSAKLEDTPREPAKLLARPLTSEPTRVSVPPRLRAWSHPGVIKSIAVLTVVSVRVVEVVEPEYCKTAHTSKAKKLPLQDAKLG